MMISTNLCKILGRTCSLIMRPLSKVPSANRDDLRQKIQTLQESQSTSPMTHQKFTGRKRFYKQVGIQKLNNNEFRITLDGRVLRTPGRNPLHLPTLHLAIAIAAEWDAQTDEKKGIEPVTMPLMTLASTAIDQILPSPSTAVENSLKYLPTDAALFFTHDQDRILLSKQRKHLSPVVRWVEREMKSEILTTSDMAGRLQHPTSTFKSFENLLTSMDHFTLACMQGATAECKSLVMATAYLKRFLSLDQIRIASRIEEEFQVEIWGVVEGGHDMDRLNNSVNLSSIGLFLSLINSTYPSEFKSLAEYFSLRNASL